MNQLMTNGLALGLGCRTPLARGLYHPARQSAYAANAVAENAPAQPFTSGLLCTEFQLRVLYESQINGYRHQDNTDVPHQPIPEPIPEEQYVCTNDNYYHHYKVKHDNYVSCHFTLQFGYFKSRLPVECPGFPQNRLAAVPILDSHVQCSGCKAAARFWATGCRLQR